MQRHREILAFLLLLTLGLAPRLALISRFPTIPVSDFHNLVAFGLHLRDDGLTSSNHPGFWENFNVGLPLVLCGLFKLFPHTDPDNVARIASAFVTGLLPLLPFWIWRGVLSFRLRVLAGATLALWPGQVLFSGVVAQDNWAIFPAIALGALAVRALAEGERASGTHVAWPVTAGLMYAAATAVRADMLVILPLLLAAVRVDLFRTKRRQVLAGSLAAGLGLFGLAAYRHAASGRFALGTEHAGVTILGAYVPGTSLPAMNGSDGLQSWIPPYAFLAWARPDLMRDHKAMLAQALGVTVREALRRPVFHALRIVSMAGYYAIHGESADLLYGSLESPEVLPAALHARGAALAARLKTPLGIEMAIIQALFLAAVIIGIRRRNWPILVLASAVLLKYGVHVLVVIYGRFFVPATGLEILMIAVAVEEILSMGPSGRRPLLARALAVGAAFSLLLIFLPPPLLAYVQKRDIDSGQHTYRFVLEPPHQSAELACVVDRGVVTSLLSQWNAAAIRTLQYDPAPGDKAVADCVLTGSGKPAPLMLQVLDSYAPGGVVGRMIQRVELDGDEVLSHDIGKDPGTGWSNILLGLVGAGTRKRVVIEVKAIRPVPGEDWGEAALTTFQIVRSAAPTHMAVAMPTAQSSTLPEYNTTKSRSAVDNDTDGNFFAGSVTSTNRDAYAWWQVDLGASSAIGSIVIWNRSDCCYSRLSDYWVFLSDTPFSPSDAPTTLQKQPGIWKSHQTVVPNPSTTIRTDGAKGRYLRVQLTGTDYLSLAEVQVFGTEK